MKKINIFFALASAAFLSAPLAININPVQAYASSEESERVFGSTNAVGEWSKSSYDKFEIASNATIIKKGEFHANLAGYNADKITQGFYKIGPSNQNVGKTGYIMVTLKSVKGDVKLADINLSLKRRGKDGAVTFNGTEWLNEKGENLPELSNEYQTYALHIPTMFAKKPNETVDWTEIHFHASKLFKDKILGIKYLYYASKSTDNWSDKGVFQLDDFNRVKLNDSKRLKNAYWVDGAGSSTLISPSYQGDTLTLVSKTYGNIDGKFSNLNITAKNGTITSLTPIYTSGENFINGDTVLYKDLKDKDNRPLGNLTSTWNTYNINLANSGIKSSTFAGFKICSKNTSLADFVFTNDVEADLRVFANEIIDKTAPHCNYKDPEVIKTIGNDWKALETKWGNMSVTAKDAFIKFKSSGSIQGKEVNMISAPKQITIGEKYKYLLGYTNVNKGVPFDTITMVINAKEDINNALTSIRIEFVCGSSKVTKWNNKGDLKDTNGNAITKGIKTGENTITIDLAKSGIDGSKITNIHIHSGSSVHKGKTINFELTSLKLSANAKVDPMIIVDQAKDRYEDIVLKYLGKHGVTDFLGIAKGNNNTFNIIFDENISIITVIGIAIISVSAIALLASIKRKSLKRN